MTKTMKTCSVLLTFYFCLCGIVMICMPLYTRFYPSVFSTACFRIGAIVNFFCALNPMGIVSAIVNIFSYVSLRRQGRKPSSWLLAWFIAGPFIAIAGWLQAIYSFVNHSGGV